MRLVPLVHRARLDLKVSREFRDQKANLALEEAREKRELKELSGLLALKVLLDHRGKLATKVPVENEVQLVLKA